MILEAPLAPLTPDPAALAEVTSPGVIEAPNDATYGWEMFVAFIAAVLGISIVVAVLALVGSWVLLGIAMAVHVGVTATMMKLVLGAFGSEDHAYPDMHQAEAASRAAILRQVNSPVAMRPRPAVGL
jgi:hypothetical protein